MSQFDPLHALISCLHKINLVPIFHLRLCLAESLFPSGFPDSLAPSTVTLNYRNSLQSKLQISYSFSMAYIVPNNPSKSGSLYICCNLLLFTIGGGGGFSPRPIPKLDDHPLSAVRNCLFSIFEATLHT
jgi:hypothetical protein